MPTNEERREVARKLRACGPLHKHHYDLVNVESVLYALGLSYADIDRLEFFRSDVDRLANLIDLETERTCRYIWDDRINAWKCSLCDGIEPVSENVNYCCDCGAKVVDYVD